AYPHVVEVSFIEPREMHLEVTTNQTFDEGGNLLGFLKVIRDTSREVDLLRVKSEFITVAAHQLRTPLSGIKWAFEALMKGDLGKTTEEQVKTADQALKTVQRLISIVDDFLDLAKIEEGKFGYEFEKADLTTLILTALEQYEELAKEKSVHLVFYRPETPLPPLLMDPRRIRLVLQNLITNAITYNVKNGEVRVRLEWLTDRPYVQISVEDTGLGIPEKDQARLFTKFFRSDNVLRVEVGGSGLGLYISRNIVKRHGGDIWVKSIEKRGTTVTFLLPTDESLIPQVEIPTQETF
ncbi:MAG: HAMP domain-containing histidine kinase, partial [Parcubacteria group bacterium]|nr:HAMP domain-containing histidine kinase [Parcubacteria group bacterium]